MWLLHTHLEVKGLAALRESYTNVRALSSITLHAQHKVSGRVEDWLHLSPRCGVCRLGEEFTGVGVLHCQHMSRSSTHLELNLALRANLKNAQTALPHERLDVPLRSLVTRD